MHETRYRVTDAKAHIVGYFLVRDGRVVGADQALQGVVLREPTPLPTRMALNRLKARRWTAQRVES
jgi:hypothetical protein